MGRFGPDVRVSRAISLWTTSKVFLSQHIVGSRDHCADPITFTSYAYTLLRLNQLDTGMFPIPSFSLTPKVSLKGMRYSPHTLVSSFTIPLDIPNLPANTQPMQSKLVAHIRPFSAPGVEGVEDKFHAALKSEDVDLPPVTRTRFNEVRERVAELEKGRQSRPGDDVLVITLGTGSAKPTTHRNGKLAYHCPSSHILISRSVVQPHPYTWMGKHIVGRR
jgi:ribonuclease Z